MTSCNVFTHMKNSWLKVSARSVQEYEPLAANESGNDLQTMIKEIKKDAVSEERERFPFLDGFRGFCAFLVVLSHSSSDAAIGMSVGADSIGVPGFFTLSSFLLTFGLLEELKSMQSFNARHLMKALLCFGIRRVLRIFPLLIPVAAMVQMPPFKGQSSFGCVDFWTIISLDRAGLCFLWSIPPEMKNYLWMPLYAACIRCSKLLIIPWIVVFKWTADNWTTLRKTESFFEGQERSMPKSYFPLFLAGSFAATVFHWYKHLKITSSRKAALIRLPFGIQALSIFGVMLKVFDVSLSCWTVYHFFNIMPRYNPSIWPPNIFNAPGYVITALILIGCILPTNSISMWLFRTKLARFMGKVSLCFLSSSFLLLNTKALPERKNRNRCNMAYPVLYILFLIQKNQDSS
jgi:peptidoglycan/LPS O-acetylase OafA/YrhL